jgi:hypothetical protein
LIHLPVLPLNGQVIASHRRVAGPAFVGVRMILNYSETVRGVCEHSESQAAA